MGTIQQFLKCSKTTLENNLHACLDIHFVIGDESCDLDSTVSSIMLAYFMDNCKSSLISDSTLIIPVLNVAKEDFLFRVENCMVLQECGISLHSIVYRDQVNFEEIIKTKQVTVSLVDHHVLSQRNLILEPMVVQIFDHHTCDETTKWKNKNVKLRIEPVGSCTTLIADEMLHEDESLVTEDIAFMMYQAILFNTKGCVPKPAQRTEMDFIIAMKLERIFHLTGDRAVMYKQLWTVHTDVLKLNAKQILLKDLEIVENVPVSCLPILAETFIYGQDSYKAIKEMAVEHKVPMIVLMGVDKYKQVKRDIGIYWTDEGENLKTVFVCFLKDSKRLKGYDFMLEEVPVLHPNIVCLKQKNVQLWRKDVVPILVDAVIDVPKLNA